MSQLNPVASSKATPGPLNLPRGSEAPESTDAAQLSRLSSVLNGLENGAARMRVHVEQAIEAVRGGTYRVDALQLSRLIVGEAMGAA
jgi:hypothetical protein